VSVEFLRKVEGCWEVKPKGHPRQACLSFLVAFILAAMAVLLLVNHVAHWRHRIPDEGWLMWLLIASGWALAVSFGNWDNRANAISWNNEAIYLRQLSPWGRFVSKFARIPYDYIESVQQRGKPPREPTLLNLIEIVLRRADRVPKRHFFVDPNYFDASSLIVFFEDLRKKAPQLTHGECGEQFDKALIQLQRKLRL
jgi:hypothetical protein